MIDFCWECGAPYTPDDLEELCPDCWEDERRGVVVVEATP